MWSYEQFSVLFFIFLWGLKQGAKSRSHMCFLWANEYSLKKWNNGSLWLEAFEVFPEQWEWHLVSSSRHAQTCPLLCIHVFPLLLSLDFQPHQADPVEHADTSLLQHHCLGSSIAHIFTSSEFVLKYHYSGSSSLTPSMSLSTPLPGLFLHQATWNIMHIPICIILSCLPLSLNCKFKESKDFECFAHCCNPWPVGERLVQRRLSTDFN